MADTKLFTTMIVSHGRILFMSQPMIEENGEQRFDHSRRIIGVANRNTPCTLRGVAMGPAKDFDDLNPHFPFPKFGMGGVLGTDVYIRIPNSWEYHDFPGVRYVDLQPGTPPAQHQPSSSEGAAPIEHPDEAATIPPAFASPPEKARPTLYPVKPTDKPTLYPVKPSGMPRFTPLKPPSSTPKLR